MESKVTINCTNTGTYKDVPVGTNLIQILKEFDVKSRHKIVTAKVNNKTEPLTYQVYNNKTVDFISISEPSGMRV
jgi:uridine kinase